MIEGPIRRGWIAGAAAMLGLLLIAGFATEARAQDPTVRELMRKVAARERDNGFCTSVPWGLADDAAQHRFLENAQVGSAEAARFAGGACSYTYITQIYPGQYGKCLRYTWWACGPNGLCASGESAWCKNAQGGFDQQ